PFHVNPSSSASLHLFLRTIAHTTEISTPSLHDALPILAVILPLDPHDDRQPQLLPRRPPLLIEHVRLKQGPEALHGHVVAGRAEDRKSTRLNSSHVSISYAVFCLKKKSKITLLNRDKRR